MQSKVQRIMIEGGVACSPRCSRAWHPHVLVLVVPVAGLAGVEAQDREGVHNIFIKRVVVAVDVVGHLRQACICTWMRVGNLRWMCLATPHEHGSVWGT